MLKVSVSSLLRYLKYSMKADERLNKIYVTGEISNYHLQRSSGHVYFSLKDEAAVINCVMFRSDAQTLKFDPVIGDKVVAYGSVSIFENSGQLQLYVSRMQPDGLGELYARFEALKRKLSEEGKFSSSHKKVLSKVYPDKIAVLVGDHSAAMSDIRTAFARRWPLCTVDYHPVLVQGSQAPEDICNVLRKVDRGGYDAVILARGGGSFEDLFCFNDESLIGTIYDMSTFIVTGIGHEQDVTLADLAADLRAPTPTAAVELITPNIEDVLNLLEDLQETMQDSVHSLLDEKKMLYDYYLEKLLHFKDRLNGISSDISNQMEQMRIRIADLIIRQKGTIDHLQNRMRSGVDFRLTEANLTFKRADTLLHAYSTENVLERGYTLVFQNGELIKRRAQLKNEAFQVKFRDGTIEAEERK